MKFKEVAAEIIQRFKTKYLTNDGMIARSYPCTSETLYSDFDDVLPFLLYFGEKEFIREQIILSTKANSNRLIVFNDKVVSWRNDEYLGALCYYYRQHRDPEVRRIIEECFASIQKYLIKDGHVLMFYDLQRNSFPKLYSTWSGGLLEVFLENSDLFSEWRAKALHTIDLWLENYSFQKYGIFVFKSHAYSRLFNLVNCRFPFHNLKFHQMLNSQFYYLPRINLRSAIMEAIVYYLLQLPTGSYFQFMKANTNFIFALVSAYRLTGKEYYRKAIEKWINAVRGKLFRDGMICGVWYANGKTINPTLTECHTMIDVLCDTYSFINRNPIYLNFAKEIADTWLGHQWPNGMFPSLPGGLYDHIDEQTDLSIALHRLAELTGDKAYSEAGRRCFLSTLKHHQTEEGYVTSVTREGKVMAGTVVDPKYNGLLLKGIINWLEEEKGNKIYKTPDLHDLLKDR